MNLKPLGVVAKVIAGQSPESSTYNSTGQGLPFFQGKADFQDMYPTVRTWCTSLKRKEAEPDDILISVRAPVGAVNICNQKSIIGRGLAAIRPLSELDGNFLYYYLKANERQIDALGTGSTFKAITQDTLKKIEIPVPPLDDQIRIAHLLGKVEGLIAQRKQHLQQLDDLLKSVFLEMFGPQALGYADWPMVEIKDLAANHKGAMRTGPFGSNLLHSEFTVEGDVAVLGIDNAVQNRFVWGERRFITNEKYKELESYQIFPGDVIVTIMGTIGRSAVIPDDIPIAINTKHLAAITLNKEIANPLFISYSIHSSPFILNQFKSKNRGAIMSGLNLGLIKETKLKRPAIELQNRFAAIHKKIDEVKSRYHESLTDLESLYGALSQKAFKGELDLSRIPMDKLVDENNADIKKKLRLSVEPSLSNNVQDTLANLNTFNQTAASHFKALEKANRLSKLPWDQLNSVSRLAEQFASFRSPLQELGHMSALSKTFEQAQAVMKKLNLERSESFTKTAELARNLALDVPKIDFDRLSLHDEFVKKANEPFESLRKSIEQLRIPSQNYFDSISSQIETAKRFQSTIPDFTTWQKNYSEVSEFDFDDSDKLFARYFEAEDVVGVISSANEPLSFESLLQQLGEFSAVDFAGYERIKAIIFDLLANNRLKQIFDKNKQTLLFSMVETEPAQ